MHDTAQCIYKIDGNNVNTLFSSRNTKQKANMTIMTFSISSVQKDVSRHYVKQTFSKLNMGNILSIVEKPLRNEKTRKRVVVRTEINPHTENGNRFSSMTHGDCLNVVHTPREPFWKVFKTS